MSLARRDIVAEYEALCAAAGAQAGLVDLSTFNVINAVLAGDRCAGGRLAAGQRRARLGVDGDSPRRRSDLLPEPRRRRRRHARRSRAPDGDVLRRPPERRRICARAALRRVERRRTARRPTSSSCGAASRSASARPSDPVDPRDAARSPIASAARPRSSMRWRRWSACWSATGRRRMIRTNLSTRPFYNERAVNVWARRARPCRGAGNRLQRDARALRLGQQHRAGLPGRAG